MATADQIATTRLLIAEPTQTTYTDAALGVRIDAASDDLNVVARDVWTEKAAALAEVPDVSEAGSSRSMGKLYDNAMKMVAYFQGLLDKATAAAVPTGTRVRRLTR